MTYKELLKVFRNVPKPSQVEGDPFGIDATTEDINRLIETDVARLRAEDFIAYVGYRTTGGVDDMRFLLPPMLRIWEDELYGYESWFTQQLHEELSRTDFIETHLDVDLRTGVLSFMHRALCARISAERSLKIEGMSPTHSWFRQMASFGVFTSDIPRLWSSLWSVREPGHACAVLQYTSCLIYSENNNPLFSPWTPDQGGGAPELWCYDSIGFKESWKECNVVFLKDTLSPEYLINGMMAIAKNHPDGELSKTALTFIQNIERTPDHVAGRCKALATALSIPSSPDVLTWESLGVE